MSIFTTLDAIAKHVIENLPVRLLLICPSLSSIALLNRCYYRQACTKRSHAGIVFTQFTSRGPPSTPCSVYPTSTARLEATSRKT